MPLFTWTAAPDWIAVEFSTRSLVAVPTEPSQTTVLPSDLSARNQAAVPVALALLSWVKALKVRTPAVAAGADVALKRSSARRTCAPRAVSALVGWVPS